MAIGNFLKNFGIVKAEQACEGTVNVLAWLDAEGVSEAAVKQKQDEHSELVKQLVDAQADFKREKREFDDILSVYNKKLAAAERAQADLEKDPTNTEAATALSELLESVEKIAPKLDKEKREFEAAEKWLTELQKAANDVAQELLGLREQLNETKNAIKQADIQLEQAQKQQKRAETIAGLRTNSNKFDVALNALQKQADSKQKEIEAARITTEQLTRPVETTSSAASKYLDETAEAPVTESLQDRLARLKAKA